jgi:hypothetical protein
MVVVAFSDESLISRNLDYNLKVGDKCEWGCCSKHFSK